MKDVILNRENEEHPVNEYLDLARKIAGSISRNYPSYEFEDLYQEGLIGLLKAIRRYNPKESASFSTFASLCIKNRILDCIRNTNDEITLDELPEPPVSEEGLDERLILEYYLKLFHEKLSQYEYDVLNLMIIGYANDEIAEQLNSSIGSIYNAKQRIRQKLADYNPWR